MHKLSDLYPDEGVDESKAHPFKGGTYQRLKEAVGDIGWKCHQLIHGWIVYLDRPDEFDDVLPSDINEEGIGAHVGEKAKGLSDEFHVAEVKAKSSIEGDAASGIKDKGPCPHLLIDGYPDPCDKGDQ